MKKAIQRLVRADDGTVRIVYIDAETLKELPSLEGYQVINQSSNYWEPVKDVRDPNTPSETVKSEHLNKPDDQSGDKSFARQQVQKTIDNVKSVTPEVKSTQSETSTRPSRSVEQQNGVGVTSQMGGGLGIGGRISSSVNAKTGDVTRQPGLDRPAYGDVAPVTKAEEIGDPRTAADISYAALSRPGVARNQRPNADFMHDIGKAVHDFFGPDYSVEVTSGKGYLAGANANHPTGKAADFNVKNNKTGEYVSQSRMEDFGAFAASELGTGFTGIGIGKGYMAPGRMHLDKVHRNATGWGKGKTGSTMTPGVEYAIESAGRTGAPVYGLGLPEYMPTTPTPRPTQDETTQISTVQMSEPKDTSFARKQTSTKTTNAKDAFFQEHYAYALAAGLSDTQARLAVSQAAIETGWGTKGKAVKGNNFFGMKTGANWSGKSVNLPTEEETSSGKRYTTNADFRQYDNPVDAYRDWKSMMETNWPDVLKASTFDDAVKALDNGKKGKYATAKAYPASLKAANTELEKSGVARQINIPNADVLDTLHPAFQDRVKAFFAEAQRRGINIAPVPTSGGYRTISQQAAIKSTGVISATPGRSYHNLGLGFDYAPVDDKNRPVWDQADPRWGQARALAEEMGLAQPIAGDLGHVQLSNLPTRVPDSLLERPKYDVAGRSYPRLDPTTQLDVAGGYGPYAHQYEPSLPGAPIGKVERATLPDVSTPSDIGTNESTGFARKQIDNALTTPSNYEQSQSNPLGRFGSVTTSGPGYTGIIGADAKEYGLYRDAATRNNNPGNLGANDWSNPVGVSQVDKEHSFAVYGTPEEGARAKASLLSGGKYRNLSIYDAMHLYAPPKDNNPTGTYIDHIVRETGVPSSRRISDLSETEFDRMLDAIGSFESPSTPVDVKDSLGRHIGSYADGQLTRDPSARGYYTDRGSLMDTPSETSGVGRGDRLGGSYSGRTGIDSPSEGRGRFGGSGLGYSGYGGLDSPSERTGRDTGFGLGSRTTTSDKEKDRSLDKDKTDHRNGGRMTD